MIEGILEQTMEALECTPEQIKRIEWMRIAYLNNPRFNAYELLANIARRCEVAALEDAINIVMLMVPVKEPVTKVDDAS